MIPRHGKNKEQAWKPNSSSVPAPAGFFCGEGKRQAVPGSSLHHGHAALTHPPASEGAAGTPCHDGAPVRERPGTRFPPFARRPHSVSCCMAVTSTRTVSVVGPAMRRTVPRTSRPQNRPLFPGNQSPRLPIAGTIILYPPDLLTEGQTFLCRKIFSQEKPQV